MKIVAVNSRAALLFEVLVQCLYCTFTMSSLSFTNNDLCLAYANVILFSWWLELSMLMWSLWLFSLLSYDVSGLSCWNYIWNKSKKKKKLLHNVALILQFKKISLITWCRKWNSIWINQNLVAWNTCTLSSDFLLSSDALLSSHDLLSSDPLSALDALPESDVCQSPQTLFYHQMLFQWNVLTASDGLASSNILLSWDTLPESDILLSWDTLLTSDIFSGIWVFQHQTLSSIRHFPSSDVLLLSGFSSRIWRSSIISYCSSFRCSCVIRCFFKNLMLFHHQTLFSHQTLFC